MIGGMEQVVPDPNRRYTYLEYFQIEAESPYKWEFRGGQIVAMAGGTVAHSRIGGNVLGELYSRLKGTHCAVYTESLRVRLVRQDQYGHPGITVICGDPQIDPDDGRGETILNPRLVVEVLSPSTELHDRTKKFHQLMARESFQEYVLVSQFEPRVEALFRHPDGQWRMRFATGLDQTIRLDSVGIDLPLAEVFAGVTFPPAEPDDGLGNIVPR